MILKQITSKIKQYLPLQRYIFGEILIKIRSPAFTSLTDKQTDRQTNAGENVKFLANVKHNLQNSISLTVTQTHLGHKSITDKNVFTLEVTVYNWRLQ